MTVCVCSWFFCCVLSSHHKSINFVHVSQKLWNFSPIQLSTKSIWPLPPSPSSETFRFVFQHSECRAYHGMSKLEHSHTLKFWRKKNPLSTDPILNDKAIKFRKRVLTVRARKKECEAMTTPHKKLSHKIWYVFKCLSQIERLWIYFAFFPPFEFDSHGAPETNLRWQSWFEIARLDCRFLFIHFFFCFHNANCESPAFFVWSFEQILMLFFQKFHHDFWKISLTAFFENCSNQLKIFSLWGRWRLRKLFKTQNEWKNQGTTTRIFQNFGNSLRSFTKLGNYKIHKMYTFCAKTTTATICGLSSVTRPHFSILSVKLWWIERNQTK